MANTRAINPTTIQITIKTPTGQTIVEGKKLLEVPRQPMPGDSGEGKGK